MAYKAVIIRCPNCNANLEVVSTVTQATCSYCGTVSRIQPKTMMFQLPKQWPPPNVMSQQERLMKLQEIKQLVPIKAHNVAVLAIAIPFVIMAVVGGVIFFAVSKAKGLVNSYKDKMSWAGHAPVLIDIDGDQVPDPIGIVRYTGDNDRAHLAAFSGKTGAKLWESETLGKYSDLGQFQFAPAGDLIVLANDRGNVIARDKANGGVKWQLSMSEKIDVMCRGQGNGLVVSTADGKWFAIDTKGKKTDAEKLVRLDRDYTSDTVRASFDGIKGELGDVCYQVGSAAWHTPQGVFALQGWSAGLANIDGMDVKLLIKRPGGGPTVALGHKQPGTQVPMVAVLGPPPTLGEDEYVDGQPVPEVDPRKKSRPKKRREQKEMLPKAKWVTEIPAVDKLVSSFDTQNTALSDKAVVILYQGANSTYRLTAFGLEDGKRLWDREIKKTTGFVPVGLVVVGDAVGLTTWQNFTAYSLADGSDRYEVGDGW